MIYQNVKLGADPELFLVDGNGHLKSAIGLIGGTKNAPRKLEVEGDAVQEDNVAVEFNIPPASSREHFVGSIGRVLAYLANYAGNKDLKLSIVPAAIFPDKELIDPRALEFGCEPDYNVYTQMENPRPELPKELQNLRSCGGHIHLSWDIDPTHKVRPWPHFTGDGIRTAEQLIKAMDLFVGCPSIQFDNDMMRRKLYGKAGAFRFKPYGVEYRTLSNFWLKDKNLVEWAYTQSMHAVDYLNSGGEIDPEHYTMINNCINNGDEGALTQLHNLYPF